MFYLFCWGWSWGVCVRGGCIFSAGARVFGCFGYGGGSEAGRGFWGIVDGIEEFCSADQC